MSTNPCGPATLLITSALAFFCRPVAADESPQPQHLDTDVLIVGGTESGWAAAIQAARMGVRSITIVHDGDWLGGQFTEQALACVDENKGVGTVGWGVDWHPMKRSFHRSGLFLELMDRIEAFNTEKYGSPMPGRPYHGPSTFRPVEAEAIFREMLQPSIDSGQTRLITNHYPVKADVDQSSERPRLTGLWFAPVEQSVTRHTNAAAGEPPQPTIHVSAKITIDASDWGEAIQLSGAAYECGPDPRSRYHEPSAPEDLANNPPNEMNPITWAMIVEQSGEPESDSNENAATPKPNLTPESRSEIRPMSPSPTPHVQLHRLGERVRVRGNSPLVIPGAGWRATKLRPPHSGPLPRNSLVKNTDVARGGAGTRRRFVTTAGIWLSRVDETPIAEPPRYDERNFARTTQLSLAEMRNLPWDRPVKLGSIPHWPDAGHESPRQLSVFNVRRLVDGTTSKTGRTLILLNYMLGQDYPLERLPQHVVNALEATEPGGSTKNIVEMTRAQRQIIFDDAKRHALSVLYHLQTFVHDRAEDTTNSFRHFRLSDEFGTSDHLPPKPYIRESLRLKAMYMMREQDGRNIDGKTKTNARERFAQVMYPDGVFCWQFHYDFHRTGRAYLQDSGDGKPWGTAGPWIDYEKPDRHTSHMSDRSMFPLRSLIPVEMDGLLGAQKNVGYSSIVCAAVRLHDQCIAIGQAAGATATIALRNDVQPRAIPFDRGLVEAVRHGLCGELGQSATASSEDNRVEPLLLFPYRDLPAGNSSFVAINRMAAMGLLPVEPLAIDFQPREPASAAWQADVIARIRNSFPTVSVPTVFAAQSADRGTFCEDCWSRISSAAPRPWQRLRPLDADADGIPDHDDPTPFTPGEPVVWKIADAPPQQDGLPDTADAERPGVRLFNFTSRDAVTVEGITNDAGLVYNDDRGYGWRSDHTANVRRRGTFPEDLRDTFAFTRDTATWECRVTNGRWHVDICVGDAAHDQPGQIVNIENQTIIADTSTAAGRFHEVSATVEVADGRLTIGLGPQRPGCNTCLNWLRIRQAGN